MQSISFPAEALDALTPVTTSQMRSIHRNMLSVSTIPLHQMLDRAGHLVYRVSTCYTSAIFPRVVVLLGKGYTGTAGLLAAQCCANAGSAVRLVFLTSDQELNQASQQQLRFLKEWYPGLPIRHLEENITGAPPEMEECDVIIDGMLGLGTRGELREPLITVVTAVNQAPVPTVSIEVPTGLQPDLGVPSSPTVLASATVTFTLPKQGFLNPRAKRYLGELYLANIGVCPRIINRVMRNESYPRNLPELLYLHVGAPTVRE